MLIYNLHYFLFDKLHLNTLLCHLSEGVQNTHPFRPYEAAQKNKVIVVEPFVACPQFFCLSLKPVQL
jgi:hypothetical protein